MQLDARLAEQPPAAGSHPADEQFRLLVQSVTDYAIFLLDPGGRVLSIADDGCGFDPAQAPRGRWGMTTMRERAEAAGGRLAVESCAGKGTTVRAAVPA